MPRRYCSPGTSRRAEASLLKRSAASIAAAEAVSQRQARELNACPLSERCPAVNGGYGRILLKNSKVERLSKSSPSRLPRMYASRWCRKSAVRLRRYLDRSRRGPSRLSIPDESSTLKIQGLCVFQQYPPNAELPCRRRVPHAEHRSILLTSFAVTAERPCNRPPPPRRR
jgi:hypothetical protein